MKRFYFLLFVFLVMSFAFKGELLAAQAPKEAVIKSFKFGEVEVIALKDFHMDMDVSLFQAAKQEVIKTIYNKDKAPASCNIFIVKTPTQTIMIDAGLGTYSKEMTGHLPELLAKIKIAPEAINTVLLTHLHFDHIGGLLDKDGNIVFKNAKIYVSAPEKDFWFDDAPMNAAPEAVKPFFSLARKGIVAYADKVEVFNWGNDVVGFKTVEASGHTPGHTAFELMVGKEKLMFWGDTVHAAALQFTDPDISAIYDIDIEKAAKTRRAIMQRAADGKYIILGAHLPFAGAGKVEAAGNKFVYKSIK